MELSLRNEIILMAVLSAVALGAALFWISRQERKEKQRDGEIFVGKSRNASSTRLYRFLREYWLTKTYVARIARRYEMLYPGLPQLIASKTVNSVLMMFGADAGLFVALYLIRPTMVNFATAILLAYIVQVSLLGGMMRKTETQMLESLDMRLSDIKHYFVGDRDLVGAVWQSLGSGSRMVNAHLQEIYKVITSDNMDQDLRTYNESYRNKYFKLFLGICAKTVEQGDSLFAGRSVFVENVNILKADIRHEIEKIRKTNFAFTGLTFVASVPIAALSFIKDWAVGNLTDLNAFYNGSLGMYAVFGCFIITYLVFVLLERLRDNGELYRQNYAGLKRVLEILPFVDRIVEGRIKRNYSKNMAITSLLKSLGENYNVRVLYLRKLIFGAVGLMLGLFMVFAAHAANRSMLLTDMEDVYSKLPTQLAANLTPQDLGGWMHEKDAGAFASSLRDAGLRNEGLVLELRDIAQGKIDKSAADSYMWYELLIIIAIAVASYNGPFFMLMFKKQFLEDYMAEEVMCFQTILSMQVYLKGMSLVELLESMEMFSRVFKPSLQTCLNNMLGDEKAAFEELRDRETYPAFQRIVDCFLMADRTDIPTAFDEVIDDIRHFQDVYALDLQIMLKKKADYAEVLAFAPATFILMCYLILPFVVMGMNMFQSSFVQDVEGGAEF